MNVVNRIAECDDGKHRMRIIDRAIGITVHNFDPVAAGTDPSAEGIAAFYRAHPEHTGGQNPYTIVGHASGLIEQALPFREIGPHALRWSAPTVGMVFLGSFNKEGPTSMAWHAMAELAAELCAALDLNPTGRMQVIGHSGELVLAGHTERPDATRDRGKHCPGIVFSMGDFRLQVKQYMREGAIQRLVQAGATA